jgi:hypothetical protein
MGNTPSREREDGCVLNVDDDGTLRDIKIRNGTDVKEIHLNWRNSSPSRKGGKSTKRHGNVTPPQLVPQWSIPQQWQQAPLWSPGQSYPPVVPGIPAVAQAVNMPQQQSPAYEALPEKFTKIPYPTHTDLLTAAYIFDQIALRSGIKYAIIGGLSAHILGSGRRTRSLDILIEPRVIGNQSYLHPLLNDLFDQNPRYLQYTRTNRFGHIVVTDGNAGVPVNFIDSVNNIFNFPKLVAPTQPDGRPWNQHDPEPTWKYQRVVLPGLQAPILLPVVLPRLLLYQRILHFERPDATLETKTNDVKDMIVYLNALHGLQNESFTDQEAQILLPRIWEIMRFAEGYWLKEICDIDKWLWINIPLA